MQRQVGGCRCAHASEPTLTSNLGGSVCPLLRGHCRRTHCWLDCQIRQLMKAGLDSTPPASPHLPVHRKAQQTLNKHFRRRSHALQLRPPQIQQSAQQERKGLSGDWLLASDSPQRRQAWRPFYELNDGYFTYFQISLCSQITPPTPKPKKKLWSWGHWGLHTIFKNF